MLSNFRKELEKYTYTLEDVKEEDNSFKLIDSDNFILETEVKSAFDSIENDINAIKDKLEEIKGLSEIDDIYKIIKELSINLY